MRGCQDLVWRRICGIKLKIASLGELLGAVKLSWLTFARAPGNNNALPATAAVQHQQPYHPAASVQHSPQLHAAAHQSHPPPPANGLAMQQPYDEARRRSLGTAGSPQYGRGEFGTPHFSANNAHTVRTRTTGTSAAASIIPYAKYAPAVVAANRADLIVPAWVCAARPSHSVTLRWCARSRQ